MEIEKPEPSASAPLMDNPNQREIMTRFAALNHPDIACAYWWQGNILYSNITEYLWKVIMSQGYTTWQVRARFPTRRRRHRLSSHSSQNPSHLPSVIIRTMIEAGFLYMQFHLFGFEVPMVYFCHTAPCPQRTECWVSRAKEKTIFLWFMFIIGKHSNLPRLSNCFVKSYSKQHYAQTVQHSELVILLDKFKVLSQVSSVDIF